MKHSPPKRLLETSPHIKEAAAAHVAQGAPPALKAAVLAKVAAGAAAPAASAGVGLALSFKGVVLAVSTAVAVAGGVWALQTPRHTAAKSPLPTGQPSIVEPVHLAIEKSQSQESAQVVPGPAGLPAHSDRAPVQRRVAPAQVPIPHRIAADVPVEVLHRREVELLAEVQRRLRLDDAAGALLLLQEAPPADSTLAEERWSLELRAQAAVGRCADVRAGLERFRERFPGSVQREHLESLCP